MNKSLHEKKLRDYAYRIAELTIGLSRSTNKEIFALTEKIQNINHCLHKGLFHVPPKVVTSEEFKKNPATYMDVEEGFTVVDENGKVKMGVVEASMLGDPMPLCPVCFYKEE